ncbi:hypothetical protein ABKV19_022024 [Rosa sericea]
MCSHHLFLSRCQLTLLHGNQTRSKKFIRVGSGRVYDQLVSHRYLSYPVLTVNAFHTLNKLRLCRRFTILISTHSFLITISSWRFVLQSLLSSCGRELERVLNFAQEDGFGSSLMQVPGDSSSGLKN